MSLGLRGRENSLLPDSVYLNLPTQIDTEIFQELPRFKNRDHEGKLIQIDQLLLRLLTNSKQRMRENWLYDIRTVSKYLAAVFHKSIRPEEVYDAQIPTSVLKFNGYNFWLDLKEGVLYFQSIKSKLLEKGYKIEPKPNGVHA